MHSVRKWTRLDGNHGTVSGRCRALFRDLSSAGTLRRKEGFVLLREARQCFSRHGNVTGRFVRVARICIRDRSRNIRFLLKISENDQDSGNFRALSTYLDRRTEIDALRVLTRTNTVLGLAAPVDSIVKEDCAVCLQGMMHRSTNTGNLRRFSGVRSLFNLPQKHAR